MCQRNSYPKSFKAQVVQECLQSGATISGVAISHGINANRYSKVDAAVPGSAASGATCFYSSEIYAKTAE